MIVLYEITMVGFIIYFFWEFLRYRRRLINNQILFEFCNQRRELMALARMGNIDVHSLAFRDLYKFMSFLIRYTRNFKFLSEAFLEQLQKSEQQIVKSDYTQRLNADAKAQGNECYAFLNKFVRSVVRAVVISDVLFPFKYKALMTRIEKDRKRRIFNPKAKIWYNDFYHWEKTFA